MLQIEKSLPVTFPLPIRDPHAVFEYAPTITYRLLPSSPTLYISTSTLSHAAPSLTPISSHPSPCAQLPIFPISQIKEKGGSLASRTVLFQISAPRVFVRALLAWCYDTFSCIIYSTVDWPEVLCELGGSLEEVGLIVIDRWGSVT